MLEVSHSNRRKLTVCPILEGEDQLRLLNYQHNAITRIQHLSTLRRLIFLDLYDNQIDQISGLSSLKSLRVLMLGKNKIKKIENLDALLKLDVLDLHGNQISKVENLNHLGELRVLNLAGNQITHVDNLSGIDALAELNLRRNKIRTVTDVDTLPNLQRLFLSFNDISRFNSKGRKVTILQCYAPTNVADEEEKENFYEQLQAALDKAPRRDLKILMGDLNAKVGTDNTDRELIMGKHGTGTQNENGELFTEFCTTNDLVIGGTIFPHKTIHKTTWTSPDGRTVNQIDHITIGRKWRRSLLDVRAKRGADAASDHHLVIAAIKIKLKAYRDQADRPSHKYNMHSLKESVKTNAFRCELRNRFSALDTLPEETIEEHWHDLRETWTATCREVLGKKTRQHKEWLTSDTWDLITERKRLKDLINHTDDQDHKRDLQAQYWDVNRQVKRSARNDKRNFINGLAEEAETAAGQRNMKRLYEITRTLSGKNNNPTRPVKDKNGQIITKEEDQRTRWAEHFKETLNRPPPPVPPDIPPAAQLLDISTNPPTKTEIIKAIKSLKSGKAAGPDGIPPEALKADIQTSTDMLHPLLRKIWESESVPQDWKKGHLVKLPKKGDLSSCSNWRGIMLLSIPGKVLTRIILERLKTALDKTLREEQAGFRNDRSCTDHIATMRIIIEQSLEWQTPLYSTFVDFQKAFDSVDREVIWKLMSHYGFPPKFVNIIRQLYEDATCQVIHDGKLTEPFTVQTGVRQGCILSPTIFLMVVDWVMRQATDGKRTGIQWTFSKQLEDLDFADDIALLSHKQQDAQEKLNRVAEEAEKTGLKINISKTEVMRVNHKQHDPIQLHQEDIKEVDKFTYLGSVVSKDGGTDEDIKSRTNKARHAFRTLRPIWRSTALSLRNKIRIFNSNVKSVLLYGSETWRTTKTSSHKLQTFINRCLRNILNIRYPLVITNQDLWERTRQVPIEQEIKKKKWGWIGHTLRKSTSNVTRQSLDWNPQGKRKVGRPKQTWRRNFAPFSVYTFPICSPPPAGTNLVHFEDVQCLGDSSSLSEICLDGNPIAQDPSYKQIVLRNMQQLKQLDMRRVTEEERRLALVMARKEEEKRREMNKVAILKEKRRLAINNAKRQWETMQGSLISKTGKLVKGGDLYANHVGSLPSAADMFSSPFQQDDYTELVSVTRSDNSGEGLNMVAELEDDTLNLYGTMALGAFDRNWGLQAAGAVTTIVFKFIDFDEICKHLHKVRSRFPSTQCLVFANTNVHSLQQISALSTVRSLDSLTIALDGNPVTKFTLWRLFTVFRLAHFTLRKINDVEVSSSDIVNAERLFGPLAHIVTGQLPQFRLNSVVGETRRKHVAANAEEKTRKGEGKGDKAHVEQPGRAAFTYVPPDETSNKRDFTRSFLNELTKEAVFADRKRVELERCNGESSALCWNKDLINL
nr:hypothetical protein BaRGS_033743 [Batillaria attramentaria]